MPTEYEKIMATQKAARAAKASAGTQARADTLSNLRAASLADKKAAAQDARNTAIAEKRAAAQAAVAEKRAGATVKVPPATLSINAGITGGLKRVEIPTTTSSTLSNTGITGGALKLAVMPSSMPAYISGNTGITGGLIKPSVIAPIPTILPVPPAVSTSIPTTLGTGIIPDENAKKLIASNILSAFFGSLKSDNTGITGGVRKPTIKTVPKKSGNTGITGGLIKPTIKTVPTLPTQTIEHTVPIDTASNKAPTVSGAPPEPVLPSSLPATTDYKPVIIGAAAVGLLLLLSL